MEFDIRIIGGTIVDGTGAPGYRGDIGIKDGRITALGKATGSAETTIDGDGMIVCPGFVDIHTHYDAQVMWDPMLTFSPWHGVTTCVMGNCGFGLAPTHPEHRDMIMLTLEKVEAMSYEALVEGIGDWPFVSFPEYLDVVDRLPKSINVGALIGHTPVRLYVMGNESMERGATVGEIDEMRRLVREGIEAGAVGFSTSSSPVHVGYKGNPVPSRFANYEEIRALDQAVREGGYTETVEPGPAGRQIGWGLACGVDGSGFVNFESARIRIDAEGNIALHSGMTSQGQGQATTFAAICAETLGTHIDRVSVAMGDTALLPFGRGAFASRGAIFGGNAVLGAATRLRARLLDHAGGLAQCDPATLSITDGLIVRDSGAETGLSVGDIARAVAPGGALFDGAPALEEQYVYKADQPVTMGMSVHAARVAVDIETGAVGLLDYFVVHDVGRALSRVIVDGQIVGGVVEGIANAFLTEMIHDGQGQPLTASLADYLAIGATDAPTVRLAHMESRPGTNPLGIRGAGEGGTIAPPAAIFNAIARIAGPGTADAVVPMTPPRVLAALAHRNT